MSNVKSWLTSKTIITAAIGVIFTILHMLHVVKFDNVDQNALADQLINLVNAALFIMAAFFRATATHKLV